VKPGELRCSRSPVMITRRALRRATVTWGASGGRSTIGASSSGSPSGATSFTPGSASAATAEAEVTKTEEPRLPPSERGNSFAVAREGARAEWMNFYTKVVARFVSAPAIELEDAARRAAERWRHRGEGRGGAVGHCAT